jgi:hypothetical protein
VLVKERDGLVGFVVSISRLDLVARYLFDSRLRNAEVQSETMAKENLG